MTVSVFRTGKLLGMLGILGAVLIPAATTQAQVAQPGIKEMHASAQLTRDGQLEVTERLTYDFGDQPQTGFVRRLQVPEPGRISVRSVTRDGLEENYRTVRAGRTKRVTVGTEGITVSGKHTYTFSYTVTGVTRSGENTFQFVWPVVAGTDMPAESITINLQLPDSAESVSCRIQVRNKGCPVDNTADGFRATADRLKPGDSLVIRAELPESAIAGSLNNSRSTPAWPYGIGLGVFVVFGWWWLHSRLYTNDTRPAPEPETPERIDTLSS